MSSCGEPTETSIRLENKSVRATIVGVNVSIPAKGDTYHYIEYFKTDIKHNESEIIFLESGWSKNATIDAIFEIYLKEPAPTNHLESSDKRRLDIKIKPGKQHHFVLEPSTAYHAEGYLVIHFVGYE
jgi:hypothetical protein